MPKITTFLTYDHQAEEATNQYVSIFPNSRIRAVTRVGEAGPGPAGSVLTVSFELDGQEFVALNGGPHFKFTEAISLSVECETQEEVDRYWEKLSEGGAQGPCGWLTDRFGVSWQVTPRILIELISHPDPQIARRAMEAMMKMQKIVIADLRRACGLD